MTIKRPEGTPQLCPYLYYRDVESALDVLTKWFGFEITNVRRGPDDQIFHADALLDDAMIMIGPGMKEFGTAAVADPDAVHANSYIYVDDVDAHFAAAKAAGATIRSEPETMPWGDRMYGASDAEGQRFTFAQHVA